MSVVDNRVVQMGFDNQQFERGVQTSLGTLDRLNKSLQLDGASKGLSNLNSFGKSFSLTGIAEGVEHIQNRFSTLGIVGFTILQNLTNAAINMGRKIITSLMTPITTGLSEYETQMNAIQTTLANTASKGTTLQDVNKALSELNLYADKTIYNFSEMTKNIGTFTAAGVDLDTSVAAIKGIANLAAVSGSNSQQASTAMYQLSQALSSGTVKLMDWNSVVNAGMGGQVFQDALKETARVQGIAIDDIIAKNGSFRESLQEGWLTSEVLTQTLQKFTGDLTEDQLKTLGYTEEQIKGIVKLGQTANDAATKVKTFTQLKDTIMESLQSGWAQSWQIVIGDFEEAKQFFTEISDILGGVIGRSSDARNKVLQEWKEMGGRTAAIQGIRNAFEALSKISETVREAFASIFPKKGKFFTDEALALKNMTFAFRDFTKSLIMSKETADKFKRIFAGIFAVFDILRMLVVAVADAFLDLATSAKPAGEGFLGFAAKIGDFLVRLHDAIKTGDVFNVAIKKIADYLVRAKDTISGFAAIVEEKFSNIRRLISELFKNVDTSGVDKFFDKFTLRFEPLKTMASILSTVISNLIRMAKKAAPTLFKFSEAVGGFLLELGTAFVEAITNLDFEKILSTINIGLLGGLIVAVKNFVTKGSGAIDGASGIFDGIKGILDSTRGSLEAWQQTIKAPIMLIIASSVAILAGALLVLSKIDAEKLAVSIGAITVMFAELMGSMSLYSKISGPAGGVGGAVALIALSTSLLILSSAVEKIAKLDPIGIQNALYTIGVMLFELLVFSSKLSKQSGSILRSSIGLIALGLSLKIIVDVIEDIAAIDTVGLSNGLISIGVILTELAAFTKLSGNMSVGKGVGLVALAGSLVIMALAVEKFAGMDAAKLQQGLIAIGAVLTEIALFTKITGGAKNVTSTAVSMVILGGAMLVFAEAISKLGDLSWEELGRGLAGMGGALLIIIGAVRMFPKNMIITAAGMIVMASALVIMADALTTMGGMTWDEISRGLVALAGSMAILSVSLIAMQGSLAGSAALIVAAAAIAIIAPALKMLGSMELSEIGSALLVLAGAFTVLGIAGLILTPVVPTLLGLGASMMLIGAAAAMVGVGILAFSAGLAALAVSGVAGAIAVVSMIGTLLGVIPLIVKSLVDAIILFGTLIIEAIPVVAGAIKELLLAVFDIIVELTPKLVEALTVLVEALIQLIRDVVPDFIDAVLDLLVTLLESIAEKIPDFIQAGFDILLGVLRGIRDNIKDVVTVAIEVVTEFIDGVAEKIPDVIESGVNLIIEFINGLAIAVEEQGPRLNAAIGRLATAIVKGLTDGLVSGVGGVVAAISRLAGAAIDTLKTLLGIFSPSRVMFDLGEEVPLGFVGGIMHLSGKVTDATKNMGRKAIDGVSGAISRIRESLSTNLDYAPTIRPVLDLEEIVSGGKEMNKMLNGMTLNLTPSVMRLSTVATGISTGVPATTGTPLGTQISFTQNNYSPEALDRIEIYRQTRNQLARLKGLP